MRKTGYVASLALVLSGCVSPQQGAIPVQDASTRVSYQEGVGQASAGPQAQAVEDAGVTVMVPQDANAAPIQTFPAQTGSAPLSTEPTQVPPVASSTQGGFHQQTYPQGVYPGAAQMPSGIPTANPGLAADEQLEGPVLALLTTASQQQSGGDLNGAAASLERAQRIAPREPQVLYRLAQVRLAQGDGAQAEQLARRGLSLANGRPALQAGLWDLIAKCREQQGDAAGAEDARQRARVTL